MMSGVNIFLIFLGLLLGILISKLYVQQLSTYFSDEHISTSGVLGSVKCPNMSCQGPSQSPQIVNVKRPFKTDDYFKRKSLYIGVVTAPKFVSSRASAVNVTWGKYAPKMEYYTNGDERISAAERHHLSVIQLPGVDHTHPPQKKVYQMLSYMHDNYINDYNWFMRANDVVYVRVPELVSFLSQLEPSEPLYVGSPGTGAPEDLEKVKLHPHEHYCMGGPGVIFSRELLIQLAPHLDECLDSVVISWNEDLEVGRCISRRLGIQCTWAYEFNELFYQDYSDGAIFKDKKIYEDKTMTSVLTMHPFNTPDMMYRIHQFFTEMKLNKLNQDKMNVMEELKRVRHNKHGHFKW